jgi:Na+/H+ antiporter NhaD/arsenite permease-like protein
MESNDKVYTAAAVVIFSLVAFTFLFPCNKFIPLDRRTVAVVGALACYLSRTYLFPSRNLDVLEAIDFDVLILLASIMVINHIVIHLKETKRLIKYFQNLIKENPKQGFWMVSFISFIVSPFLTNDGVCLLFVEPILFAFQDAVDDQSHPDESNTSNSNSNLEKTDILYFVLALSCSTNIGSTLTYTGNPQNMIVASDSIDVMPSYKFLLYMILPGTLSWIISKFLLII